MPAGDATVTSRTMRREQPIEQKTVTDTIERTTMESENLNELLHRLHDQLEDTESVEDPEVRALMADVQGHIRQALEGSPQTSPEHHRRLLDRLSEAAERFEASHPRLALTIGQTINSLSNAGI